MDMRALAAIAAIGAVTALGVTSAEAAPATHREAAVCGPVVALIEYWLPITDRATPVAPGAKVPYPFAPAATEIFGVSEYAPAGWSFYAEAVGATIGTLGAGSDPAIWQPHLRADLAKVRAACPSLAASVVNGPLPQ